MKINQNGGHLDQMLRQTRNHHVQLSTMADAKANALMTLSGVMTTFSASFVSRPNFQAAVIVLMCFNLTTILLATFTVMPALNPLGRKTPDPGIPSPGPNLLFFGAFVGMSYPQYEAAMEEVMNDPSRTYEMQVREIYTLGQFLAAKKYRFLRYAYFSFLTGVILSGIILVVVNLGSPRWLD